MSVVYLGKSKTPTIYIATYNLGFYLSKDGGKTFEEIEPSELYEYINGSWKQIKLPENAQTVRDIYYKNGTLYITGTATPKWGSKNNVDFTNYGGGIYTYKNGKFTQIFNEKQSTTSVVVDSKGTIYVSDIEGNIYRKPVKGKFKKK